MLKQRRVKKLIHHEIYHNNCHDYLKTFYLEKYAAGRYKDFLYQIKNSIPKLNICMETPENIYDDIIVCDQHAVIFGTKDDIYPILATYALNACIGLILYVPKYQVAALAHIDGLPGYSKRSAIEDGVDIDFDPVMENLHIIIKYLRHLSGTSDKIVVEYYLVGGIFELSEIMVFDIIQAIQKFSNDKYEFIFKGRNLLGPENQARNICIDSRTGLITYFDYMANVEFYGDIVNKEGIPANIIKAPRVSEAYLDITYVPLMLNNNFITI